MKDPLDQKWFYSPTTKTVRTDPENYCVTLIECFTKGGHSDMALDHEKVVHLIAAAPELYRAAFKAFHLLGVLTNDHPSVTKKLKDALQKARGENEKN